MKKVVTLKEIVSGINKQGISMRRRFALFLICCLIAAIAVLFLLLSITGILNPTENELEETLTHQLDYTENHLYHDLDQLAAYALEFSKQMSAQIEALGIPFDDLRNNTEALSSLQQNAYDTIWNNLQLADCSGAFYLLDTTVNDHLPDSYYNGMYLKYANVGSNMMLHNSVCMFRGFSKVARQHNINLFSTWECETKTNTFAQLEAMFGQSYSDDDSGYLLTSVCQLPESWEKVRLLGVPIFDQHGKMIGVCGYEISDPFFQSAYLSSDAEFKYMVCGLFDQTNDTCTGQIAPNRSGYLPPLHDTFVHTPGAPFHTFSNENITLIGKTKEIRIGDSTHMVAALLPEKQYHTYVRIEQAKAVFVFLIMTILSIFVCLIVSRRYVHPLLISIEQIKARQFDCDTHIPEIDDLFAFLANQDRINEAALSKAEQDKANALTTIQQMQTQYQEASKQVERLAYSRKDEIDPWDYETFKNGLNSLTKKEKEVFSYYIQGKSVKEIVSLMELQESTIRFHNKNIYSKLGVHSLKQLLRFAAVLHHEQKDKAIDTFYSKW